MADYSERATQLPEARPVSNVTPANSALVESAGQMVDLFTEYEKTGKKEAFAEGTRNNYFQFLGSATDEVRDIAKADKLAADASLGKPVSPEDQSWIKNHQDAVNQNKAAYEQGFKRLRDFRLDEERRLRTAIQARPDLGDELRAISQKELGIDVYTASMKIFNEDLQAAQAAAEASNAAEGKRVSQNMSRAKYFMSDVGGFAAEIYRKVDPAAPPEAPNSIESADAEYNAYVSAKPELRSEGALNIARQQVVTSGREFNKFVAEAGLNDPAQMQIILADPAKTNSTIKKIDDNIATLNNTIASASSIGTGAYEAQSKAVVQLAQQEIAELESLKKNFTAEGFKTYVESSQNREKIQVMGAAPEIVNIAGDIVPKGATDADRTKAIATADTLTRRATAQATQTGNWNSAAEYTTTAANSVPLVGNMLLGESLRSPALLPARAPMAASFITTVAYTLSNPYRDSNGMLIAAPMESIFSRNGTGFLNLVTQSSGTMVNVYKAINPEQQDFLVRGITATANTYVQQKYQQALAYLPEDAKKYLGAFKINGPQDLNRENGDLLGWVPNTPKEIKDKYQAKIDSVQYSESGPNGMKLVYRTINSMVAPENVGLFTGMIGK